MDVFSQGKQCAYNNQKLMALLSSDPALTEGSTKAFLPEFIVALLLLKSKPRTLSSRDYLLQLHSYIRNRPLSDRLTASTNHLDTIAYWRNAYTKSEETQVQLRAKVAELEQGEEGLNGRHLRSLAWTRSPRKRKRATTDLSDPSSHGGQKQARVRTTSRILNAQKEGHTDTRSEIATPGDGPQSMSVVTQEMESSALGPCNLLIHNLYLLQEVVARRHSDPKELATALCTVSACICKLILAMQSSKDAQDAGPSPVNGSGMRRHEGSAAFPKPLDVNTTILAIRQAFPSLLRGLHRLNNLPGGPQARGQVIWNLSKIFDSLLEKIYSLSTVHPLQRPKTAPRVPKSCTNTQLSVTTSPEETQSRSKTRTPCQACRRRHRKCDGRVPTCRNCENWRMQCKRDPQPASGNTTTSKSSPSITTPPESALALCELATTMMRCLDATIPSHTDVLEGFLFLLLKRVGEALKVFVFEDGIIQDAEVDATGSIAPKETPTNHQAIQAQAPCLIYLLEEAKSITLTLNSQPHAIPTFTQLPQQSRTSSSTPSTMNLSNHAQIRLQHTLLTAVFGDQTSDFQATFTPPDTPTGESIAAKSGEGIRPEGVKDWFKQEVWRIIGWDALRQAIQLGEDKR